MSKNKQIELDIDGTQKPAYKTRKLKQQGGSIIATVPRKLLNQVADELKIDLITFITRYELAFDVYPDAKGSLKNGIVEIYFVEKGSIPK